MALGIYIIFLCIAIGLRPLIQYRNTGDFGIRLVSRNANIITKLSSLMLMTGFLGSLALTIIDFMNPLSGMIGKAPWQLWIGVFLGVVGIVITAIAQLQMGKDWRIGVDEAEQTGLVTRGLYRYSRNPIYSGVIIFILGLLLMVPNWLMLLLGGLIYLSIEMQVRGVEEPYLRNLHGQDFAEYCQQVGRYLPKIH
ncbi:MAG: methyltransferase family protein [Arenicella sp.]